MLKRSKDVEGENKDATTPASPAPGDAGATHGTESKAAASPEQSSAEFATQLQAKDRELGELKDKYLRALADTENVRKRMRQQNEETVRLQREGLLRELLPVVDNLERALDAARGGSNRQSITEGVEMVLRSLHDLLRMHGVTAITAVGQPFDPQVHEAVDHVPSEEHPPNTVVSEFHRGYLIGDRMLRPSRVSVSKGDTGGAGQGDSRNVDG
ncbi:MAG TPA: nucleotide exchange factor GrpE [Candidatus Binataceae bacterium]|nr:nucleotide exchange factor GrpE [Candidatus Binataceae bacterium]